MIVAETKQAKHPTAHTVEAFKQLNEKSIHLDPQSQPIKRSKLNKRGHSLAVKPQPSKLVSPVRSRVPAPNLSH